MENSTGMVKYIHPFCTRHCRQCNCWDNIEVFNWYWSYYHKTPATILSNDNKEVLFHPSYSTGTAIVRGEVSFKPNLHYYWEVKIMSKLYGTDVMIGVGTSDLVLTENELVFCSMLGLDSRSWGYSYQGNIQHNRLIRKYGSEFGLGSLVGVHLDMYKGTLQYYHNRISQGIAFTGLKTRELYPMICSTAAQSVMRTTCAVSEEDSLQLRCLQVISRHPSLCKRYKQIRGLTKFYQRKYFWIIPPDVADEEKLLKMPLSEEVLPSLFLKNNLHTIH